MDLLDPKLVLMLAVGTLLLVGGILDVAWRRRTGHEAETDTSHTPQV